MSMFIWLFMQSEIRHESFQDYRRQGAGMSTHEEGSIVYGEEINQNQRQTLAINSKRAEILELLKSENCIIVKGFSECGKTTQVPQFILDDLRQNNVSCNIVVTQPRRIAAIRVAKRVCEERNLALGTVVGYQVNIPLCGNLNSNY